jgi:hypothetical protein
MTPVRDSGCEPPNEERRRRVLRAGAFQILWALLLIYLILFGLALLFGRDVGYEVSFGVCLGIAGLVTAAFGAIYFLDRGSAMIARKRSKRP